MSVHPFYDYKKFAIVYVDDEEKSLKYFREAFEDEFRIFTATNAAEGGRIFEQLRNEVAILLTDQRMPGEKGVELLERARQIQPRALRILVTAYSDMDTAIQAVNTGAIYKYITKPWDPPELETTLRRGMEFFIVQRERDHLLREKMSVLHNMMIADRVVSLGLLAAGLSHHIRNSLVAVKTFLDLAPAKLAEENLDIEELRNPDFWREYYGHVQIQVDRITSLLRDLWEASAKPGLEFSDEVRLNEVIDQTTADLHGELAAKQITVENAVPASLPVLHVDRPKFLRLFELLLRDETVSLPEGSRVTISAEPSDASGQEVRIQLRDNGPGLPQEALRLIFDPFALRSDTPQEYGIGLMACYLIIYHHGGRIEAQSDDQGTVFTITLPVRPQPRAFDDEQRDFVNKVMLNDTLWEKILAHQ